MNEYFRRPQDVLKAIRSLGNLGLSVSLPDLRVNGEMFFRIEGREVSVAHILELHDKNELEATALRQFGALPKVAAAKCGK